MAVDTSSITASEYVEFQKWSCLRVGGFSSVYYTLGLVEEVTEVFRAIRRKAPECEIVKECGDVLWYTTGLLHKHHLSLSRLVGSSFEAVEPLPHDTEPEISLMMAAGALAGRQKKFERGDYDEKELKDFVRKLVPEVLSSLQTILLDKNKHLAFADECNRTKVVKRLSMDMIKGDGSDRGSTFMADASSSARVL